MLPLLTFQQALGVSVAVFRRFSFGSLVCVPRCSVKHWGPVAVSGNLVGKFVSGSFVRTFGMDTSLFSQALGSSCCVRKFGLELCFRNFSLEVWHGCLVFNQAFGVQLLCQEVLFGSVV